MNVRIDESWRAVLQPEFDKPYFEILTSFVRRAYLTSTCYPSARLIFHAFDACPFDKVRVVILGQDPYHEPGQAEGWAFSVPDGVRIPPSLKIFIRSCSVTLASLFLHPDIWRLG